MRQELLDKLWEAADRAGRGADVEVVDVEFTGGGKHRLLRVSIDRDGGVSHADCETVSSALSEVLDTGDLIPGGEYTLEVTSPGVERKLSRPRDFERSVGKKVKVVTRQPLDGAAVWTGTLTAFDGQTLSIEAAGGKLAAIPLDQVKKANLKFEW